MCVNHFIAYVLCAVEVGCVWEACSVEDDILQFSRRWHFEVSFSEVDRHGIFYSTKLHFKYWCIIPKKRNVIQWPHAIEKKTVIMGLSIVGMSKEYDVDMGLVVKEIILLDLLIAENT